MKILITLFFSSLSICLASETSRCGFNVKQRAESLLTKSTCLSTNTTIDEFTKIIVSKHLKGGTLTELKLHSVNIKIFSTDQFDGLGDVPKITIDNCTGLYNLENFLFVKKLESVELKNSDLEVVGEKPFAKLFRLVTLKLNNNQIKLVHNKAFTDLFKVEEIDLSFNQIFWLNGDTFESCLELRKLKLNSNLMTTFPPDLVSKNSKLFHFDLMNNQILSISSGFDLPLKTLDILDLRENVCINVIFNITNSSGFREKSAKAFSSCYMNHELLHYVNRTINKWRAAFENMIIESNFTDLKKPMDNYVETFELVDIPLKPKTAEFMRLAEGYDKLQSWIISFAASLITLAIVIVIILVTYRKIIAKFMAHAPQSVVMATLESEV